MRAPFPSRPLLLCSLVALALVGCGGGGGGGDGTTDTPAAATPDPTPVKTAVILSGVAATGAAFTGGVVTVTDAAGTVVGTSAAVGDDGVFSVTLSADAKAPFVLAASRPGLNGQTESLVSVVSNATSGTVNVTPVTTLIAALLSPSGDPAKLAAEVQAGTATVSASTVATKVEQVQTLLAPLLTATGTAGTNPLTGNFSTNGAGYDRLLDSVHVSIVPAGTATSNIEVAIKQKAEDGEQPAMVSFNNGSNLTAVQLPTVSASALVEEGTSVKITNLMAALTVCYGLPLADRVNGVTAGATAVVGTAADVKAPACRSVFTGDDPASYLSNGQRVGRDAKGNGSFNGLFREGATGAVFSQGSYEFTRANGDIVISYKSRDTAGNEAFDALVVRKDATDGKLKLVGNQYVYPGSVVPYQQVRQFITLNQSAYDFRSSGYVVNVDNKTDSAGNPVFDRVEVLTPRGTTLVLRPTRGYGYLGLVKAGRTLGTNFVRLRSDFIDPATSADFSTIEPSLFFANTPTSEDELAALPSQALWTYRYFLAGNTGSTPDAVQAYKTRARALTIGELKQRTLSTLNAGVIAAVQAKASATTGTVPLPVDQSLDLGDPTTGGGWTVALGALPATSVSIYGSHNGSGFNDVVNFGSTARTTRLACAPATVSDLHCSTSVSGAFANGAVGSGLHLWARDGSGREYANFYAMYKLALN